MAPDFFYSLWNSTVTFLVHVNQFLTTKGCIYLADFLLILLFALKLQPKRKKKNRVKIPNIMNTAAIQNVDLIAGDDVITTQLDLAKAYIEMGENNLAKDILNYVSVQGNLLQKKQAEKLTIGL